MENQLAKFKLKFGTKAPELNAETYAQMLLSTVTLAEEYANKLETGAKIELKVVAEKEGSYETEILIIAAGGVGVTSYILTPEGIALAKSFGSAIVTGISKIWALKKYLKGEKPASIRTDGDGSLVISGDNNSPITINQNTYNVYLQDDSQNSMKKAFGALSNDPDVNTFSLLDENNNEIFIAEKEDFKQLSAPVEIDEPQRRKKTVKATLPIIKQSFERNRKSDFIYKGITISAFISSDQFWAKVDKGEQFAKGDKLITTLEIEEEYLPDVKAWVIKNYKIIDVVEHKPSNGQPSLFPKMHGKKQLSKRATKSISKKSLSQTKPTSTNKKTK